MERIKGKVYLVTGTTSGVGEDVARALVKGGAIVYGGARRETRLRGVKPVIMDITDTESVNAAVSAVLAAEGSIYGVINCAGSGIAGALEDTTPDEVLEQLNINTVGALRVVQAVLPSMRTRNEGVIVNIGSIGADFPIPFQGTYSMAKAALRKETELLRLELFPYGIEICVIEPGDLKTGFTAKRTFTEKSKGSDYERRARLAVAQMAKDEQNGSEPSCVTKKLLHLLKKKHLPACVSVGGIYVTFPFLGRVLPYKAVENIIASMYHVRSF